MLHKLAAALCSTLFLTACWANDGPDDLRYSIASYPGWNIISFHDYPNSISDTPNLSLGKWMNDGWNTNLGSDTAQDYRRLEENRTDIRFNLLWYEVDTGNSYQAKIKVDSRDLGNDHINPEAGLLVLRIAKAGEIQAVTYDTRRDPTGKNPIILAEECGRPISITGSEAKVEIERILGETSSGKYHRIDGDKVPSSCE